MQMKLVIDIPESLLNECKRLGDKNDILFEALRNAKPLLNYFMRDCESCKAEQYVDPILIDKLCGNSGYILTKEEIEKIMEEKEDE